MSTVEEYIEETIRVKQEILKTKLKTICLITEVIKEAYKQGNKVVWFGNGGSAADAQHLACELVSKFYFERKALASIALTTNTSELTAIANDYDFSEIFARQVEALVNKGDIVVGITTSGNSLNVLKGIQKAKKMGAITIAFTGETGGYLKESRHVDYLLSVPSKDTPHIQESHIMIGHIICLLVERGMFTK